MADRKNERITRRIELPPPDAEESDSDSESDSEEERITRSIDLPPPGGEEHESHTGSETEEEEEKQLHQVAQIVEPLPALKQAVASSSSNSQEHKKAKEGLLTRLNKLRPIALYGVGAAMAVAAYFYATYHEGVGDSLVASAAPDAMMMNQAALANTTDVINQVASVTQSLKLNDTLAATASQLLAAVATAIPIAATNSIANITNWMANASSSTTNSDLVHEPEESKTDERDAEQQIDTDTENTIDLNLTQEVIKSAKQIDPETLPPEFQTPFKQFMENYKKEGNEYVAEQLEEGINKNEEGLPDDSWQDENLWEKVGKLLDGEMKVRYSDLNQPRDWLARVVFELGDGVTMQLSVAKQAVFLVIDVLDMIRKLFQAPNIDPNTLPPNRSQFSESYILLLKTILRIQRWLGVLRWPNSHVEQLTTYNIVFSLALRRWFPRYWQLVWSCIKILLQTEYNMLRSFAGMAFLSVGFAFVDPRIGALVPLAAAALRGLRPGRALDPDAGRLIEGDNLNDFEIGEALQRQRLELQHQLLHQQAYQQANQFYFNRPMWLAPQAPYGYNYPPHQGGSQPMFQLGPGGAITANSLCMRRTRRR